MRITDAMGAWRLRLALLVSVCAIASLSATGAARANHSIDVNFTIDSQNFSPGPAPSFAYAFGHVESGPTPCVRDRSFKLYKLEPRILIDAGRSSRNGFFALGGDLSGASTVQIRMEKERFGPRAKPRLHTCESDTNTFSSN